MCFQCLNFQNVLPVGGGTPSNTPTPGKGTDHRGQAISIFKIVFISCLLMKDKYCSVVSVCLNCPAQSLDTLRLMQAWSFAPWPSALLFLTKYVFLGQNTVFFLSEYCFCFLKVGISALSTPEH